LITPQKSTLASAPVTSSRLTQSNQSKKRGKPMKLGSSLSKKTSEGKLKLKLK